MRKMAIEQDELVKLLDELLFYGSTTRFKNEIQSASELFSKSDDNDLKLSTDVGFTDWYIHDYKFSNQLFLVDSFRKDRTLESNEKEILDSIENSILSIFEIHGDEGKFFIKDIFTKRDYAIQNQAFLAISNAEDLHLMRIYPSESLFIVLESTVVGSNFKEVLIKTLFEHYNQYSRIAGAVDIEGFVKNNPLVIYKIAHILEELEFETVFEDEYKVYQSVYIYKEVKDVLRVLDSNDRFECTLNEGDCFVYKFLDKEDKTIEISEIVLCDNRLEAECLNSIDLEDVKKHIEELLEGIVVYVGDEIVDFDDLI